MVIVSDPKISMKFSSLSFDGFLSIVVFFLAPALTNYNIKYAQKHFENLETLSHWSILYTNHTQIVYQFFGEFFFFFEENYLLDKYFFNFIKQKLK